MSVTEIEPVIVTASKTADEYPGLFAENSSAMRYALIDPILWALGWRTWLPWECLPDLELRSRGKVDYGLFDRDGAIAILVQSREPRRNWRSDRNSLAVYARGRTHGIAVLTDGIRWEIYDLSVRNRLFDDKRVARLVFAFQPSRSFRSSRSRIASPDGQGSRVVTGFSRLKLLRFAEELLILVSDGDSVDVLRFDGSKSTEIDTG